jgi:hypothetical protein
MQIFVAQDKARPYREYTRRKPGGSQAYERFSD